MANRVRGVIIFVISTSCIFLTSALGFCLAAQTCPPYTKTVAVRGDLDGLPKGFLVYSYGWKSMVLGMYVSPTAEFEPVLIPHTGKHKPRSLNISDNGNWILYYDSFEGKTYLIKPDGSYPTEVPTNGIVPSVVGFFRNSPYGTEVFYDSRDTTEQTLRAVGVSLTDSTPVFGETRVFADLTGTHVLGTDQNIGVSRDEVFTGIHVVTDQGLIQRTGFLTIPDSGRGIATSENIFQWQDDSLISMFGCDHDLSQDGTLAVANAGGIGNIPGFFGCMPVSHRGFYITPFRHDTDPPVGIHEHATVYGTSINFCPQEYRYGAWDEVDFRGWHFSNRKEYLTASVSGTRPPTRSVWIVHWPSNTWTQISPSLEDLEVEMPALYFGDFDESHILPCDTCDTTPADTADSIALIDDPEYRIISPNGGELFHVGEQCSVVVTAVRQAKAVLKLKFGRYTLKIPEAGVAINPYEDTLHVFTIRATYQREEYNPVSGEVETVNLSPVSDKCKIVVEDYNVPVIDDESDDYFSIAPSAGARPPAGRGSGSQHRFRVWSLGGSLAHVTFVTSSSRPGRKHVSVALYDAFGSEVLTLPETWVGGGEHSVTFDISSLARGLYVCRLSLGEQTQTCRAWLGR